MKRVSVIAFLFLSMLLVAPAFAYTGSADFPELFKYSNQKNANLETALLSISSSFKDNSIPITQELLSAIMATLDKEVGSNYLPIEENGDYGMGTDCTYKESGSCRSTSYDGGVDYKGRGYIQITGKANYQTYCGSDCVGTSTPELDICGCKNQWQCTVTDASICPQVKALQPEYAARIFALYYVTNKLVSLSNSKNYRDVGKIINGGNAYASDFSIKANEYLTMFSNNPDKTQKLLTWLDSGTPASTPVAADVLSIGTPGPSTSSQPNQPITLTLYVHDGDKNGPVIPSAQVTGQDGSGNSFQHTTDSNGYVTITGEPGTWSFSASADGYETNSWDQEITETDRKDAYLKKSAVPTSQGSESSVVGEWLVTQDWGRWQFMQPEDPMPINFNEDGTLTGYDDVHKGSWVQSGDTIRWQFDYGRLTESMDTLSEVKAVFEGTIETNTMKGTITCEAPIDTSEGEQYLTGSWSAKRS